MKLLIFLLFIGMLSASTTYLEVPALTEDGGGALINISLEMRPGAGNVYVSVYPTAGGQFQESIVNSIESVVDDDAMKDKDFLIRTDASRVASSLDGPSAGTAIGILALSLLGDGNVRHDITITGGLDEHGSIIPVGGLVEKAEVASASGKRAILIPSSSLLDDKIGLERIRNTYKIAIMEYDDFGDAYDAFTDPNAELATAITYPEAGFSLTDSGLANITGNTDFEPPVNLMIGMLDAEVEKINEDFPDAYAYFKRKAGLAHGLYERGYTYSAGNEAFLSLYRIAVLSSDLSSHSINESVVQLHECLDRTRENLAHYSGPPEHFANAELRYYWAENELAQLSEPASETQAVNYAFSLERARLWCMLAESLSEKTGNYSVNISRMKSLDETLLNRYAGNMSEDLAKAADAYNKGYYGASLMQITFHESSTNSTYDDALANYSGEREWTKMMLAHSRYLDSNREYGENAGTAIARFAVFMDIHMDEIEEEVLEGNVSHGRAPPPSSDDVGSAIHSGGRGDGISENLTELILLMLIPICIALVLLYKYWIA